MRFEKSRLEPITMTLGGVKYPVFLTNGGMMELEELTGKKFTEIIDMYATGDYGAKDIRDTTYVMLRGGGVDVTLDDLEYAEFNLGIIDILQSALNNYGNIQSLLETPEGNEEKKPEAK